MHDMAIHWNGEQPDPTRNPFIHIFWHRLPSSFKHPNSASVISSAQQCKSLSLSITHHPAIVKIHARQRKDSLTHIWKLSYYCCFCGTVESLPPYATTVQVSTAQNCWERSPEWGGPPCPTTTPLGLGWRQSPPWQGSWAGQTGRSPSALWPEITGP